jgi:EmrB/QacA subfamily drug resistance transporter
MGSALNVAMPAIGAEFHASAVVLNWIVGAFLVASAALLLPAGRLADLVGRKRVFVAGMLGHAVTSLGCAFAPRAASLIVLRFLQGGSAAFGFATGMAILTAAAPPNQRGRALGIVNGAVYAGLTLGPVLGGAITQHLGWRAIFLASSLVSAAVGIGMAAGVGQEWRAARQGHFDLPGAAVYTCCVAALIAGLSAWRTLPAGRWLALAAAAGLFVFLQRQAAVAEPLLDVGLFRNTIFAFSNLAALIHYSATFAVSFLLSLYLQVTLGLDPQRTGLVLLVQPAIMTVLSPLSGWISDRVEPRLVASSGMLLTLAGLLALSTLRLDSDTATVVAILLVLGAGFGLFSSPNSNAVMSAVDRSQYGVGSATLATMRLVGQSLSLAAVAVLFAHFFGTEPISPAHAATLVESNHVTFLLFAVLCAFGVAASLARGRMHHP